MRYLLLFSMLSLVVSGCTSVRTYTYRRDRVDQKVAGNQGVLQGQVPSAYENDKKRTLIGVDIETPLLPWQKQPQIEGNYSVDRPNATAVKTEAKPAPVRKAPKPRAAKVVEEVVVQEEVLTVKGEVIAVKGEVTVEDDIVLSDEEASEWIK